MNKPLRIKPPTHSEVWINNRLRILKMCRSLGAVSVKVHAPSLMQNTPILFKITFSRNASLARCLPEIQQRLTTLFKTDVIVVNQSDPADADVLDQEFVLV